MFNFSNLPTWGKWIAGIIIGFFVTFGIVQFDHLLPSSESNKSVERIEVKFEVRTEEEEPIENVEVRFTSNNAPEEKYTDSLGFVTINIPKRKDIEITLIKQGFETYRRVLNIDPGEDRTRIIRLTKKEESTSQLLIDYQYITAQNHFFPLILSLLKPNFEIKIVKKIFSDVLGIDKYPLIHANEVYKNINRFKSESSKNRVLPAELNNATFFTSKFFGEDFATTSTGKIYEGNGFQEIQVQESERVSTSESDTDFCEYTFAPVLNPFKTGNKNAQYTSFLEQYETSITNYQSSEEDKNVNYGYILQFPKLSDINLSSRNFTDISCGNKIQDIWLQKIIQNNPNHRGLLGFVLPIEFGFNTRSFGENFSNIEHRNIDKNRLEELDSIFISKPLSEREIEMMGSGQGNEIQPRPINQIFFTKEFKEKSGSLEELDSLIPNRFSVGEVINVNSIIIDGKEIQLDSPNNEPTTITVAASVQFGSCPYLLIYDGKNWLELGTVLSDRNKKSLQKEEIYRLGKNTLKFKIEERESEISYIDMISILYIDPETQETREVVYPITELKKADENYYLLRQGEYLDIDLKNLIPANASDVRLKINGYFETI